MATPRLTGLSISLPTSLLVEPLNVDDLTAALKRLLDDPDLASQLGARAKEEAIKRFSHIYQCEQWEGLLRELVGSGPATIS